MAGRAQLKFVMTECSKTNSLDAAQILNAYDKEARVKAIFTDMSLEHLIFTLNWKFHNFHPQSISFLNTAIFSGKTDNAFENYDVFVSGKRKSAFNMIGSVSF